MSLPTLSEIPPDPESRFLSKRRGQKRLHIETVGDLIDALAPFRDRLLFVDAGLEDVGVVGDIVLIEGAPEVLLDIISQDS